MKYPIAILVLLFLSSVCAQELIIDSQTNYYNTGTQFAKTYQYPQWNSELDFAIYGWFKLNSAYPRNEWATAFHFTSNGNNWSNASAYGDRVLAFFTINNWLHNPTYTIAQGNTNYYDNVVYNAGDLDQWGFFYIAHGSKQSAQFSYYKLAQSGELTKKYTQITHQPSNFYQINVGQSFSYKYFPGSLWRVSIIGGANAYRESGFDQLYSVNPTQAPSCVTVYAGCAFSGAATSVCQNIPTFNVSTIKSIYIPSGYTLTVYDTGNYSGKKITYNQSIECVSSFNWSMLVSTGAITVEDVEDVKPALRKSSKKHH